ncbi:hypothetical protein DESUT3_30570 [Desulfuromonas versatilis]|uniref:GspL periplasmic domain-containing protein n=1 Tax=Desulfuromonas versatilis TaxID=2802975 RepID=A0ABM8HZ48_9BACT|nr:type II secretion system protein GspL [Desulfuromonas versatilis]BCR05988.1 hypothetical protein DESUT3_30570 [Desulfuromonas versatilis]
MAKRLIGIDIDRDQVRIAVVSEEKGVYTLSALERAGFATAQELAAAIREALQGEARYGDRMAAALPAGEAFVRWLQFPFSDGKKIEAALPFELSAQLPVPVEDSVLSFQKPVASGEKFQVAAAAVRQEVVREFLLPFDQAAIPLNFLDVAPFAFAGGLRESCPDGILLLLRAAEVTVARLAEGRVADYLLLPAAPKDEAGLVRRLQREIALLQRKAGLSELPVLLAGAGATPGLAESLRQADIQAELPRLPFGGESLEAEFIPAAALALRAGIPEKEHEFNLRSGPFAMKSEWASLKRGLVTAAGLLLLTSAALTASAWLNYNHKAGRAEALQQEMVRIYRQTFPGARAIVDVPLQMRSGITELEKRGRLIGAGVQGTALGVLREVSATLPEDVTLDVRDLTYGPDSVRLEGYTTSFDAINRMARSLEKSPLFKEAQISDAKMSLDGSRVDFRMNLTFSEEQQAR